MTGGLTRVVIVVTVGLLFSAPVTAQSIPEAMHGRWRVDVAASLEDLEHLAKFSRSDSEVERAKSFLERTEQRLELAVDASSIRVRHREQELTIPCDTRYDNTEMCVLRCRANDKQFTFTVVFRENDRMKAFSSDTDDNDIFVWRRVAPPRE